MLAFLRKQMQAALEERAALKTALDGVIEAPTKENRALTDEETSRFNEARSAVKAKDDEIEGMRARISELEESEARDAKAAELRKQFGQEGPQPTGARVTSEPLTYQRGNGHSYFMDLANSQLRNDGAAMSRLQRHETELRVEMPARERRREEAANRELRSINGLSERQHESVFEKRVAPNRTDGQGGYFVPPLWLIDEYIDLPRFGRPFANAVRNLTLPPGTDSINLPKIATGTATGMQTADAAAVTSTDMTDTFVTAPVRTIAGQQDVAMQLLDQSPITFDEIVFADLVADYNQRLDTQLLSGTGAAGQVTGVLNTAGINAITYTDATPTLPELHTPWVQSVSQIYTNRKMPATATFCTPAIWFWAMSQLDPNNRPLILPEQNGPFNPLALQTGEIAEGPVGRLTVGTPVLLDGNIPSNLGAGTNESRIVTARTSDLYLWEGSMRTRVLQEVLSGTLQVRFQLYNYLAFMPDRLPKSISVVSGTGMIPTAGF
ncbi:phage major capsid protein [Streptomyces chryseus]